MALTPPRSPRTPRREPPGRPPSPPQQPPPLDPEIAAALFGDTATDWASGTFFHTKGGLKDQILDIDKVDLQGRDEKLKLAEEALRLKEEDIAKREEHFLEQERQAALTRAREGKAAEEQLGARDAELAEAEAKVSAQHAEVAEETARLAELRKSLLAEMRCVCLALAPPGEEEVGHEDEDDYEVLLTDIKRFRRALDDTRKHLDKEQNAHRNDELSLQERRDALDAEAFRQKQQMEEIERLRSELELHREHVAARESELQKLAAERNLAESSRAEGEDRREEDLKRHQDECHGLRRQLDEQAKDLKAREERLEQRTEAIDAKQASKQREQDSLAEELEQRIKALDAKEAALIEAQAEFEKQRAELRKSKEERERQLEERIRAADAREASLARLEADLEQQQSKEIASAAALEPDFSAKEAALRRKSTELGARDEALRKREAENQERLAQQEEICARRAADLDAKLDNLRRSEQQAIREIADGEDRLRVRAAELDARERQLAAGAALQQQAGLSPAEEASLRQRLADLEEREARFRDEESQRQREMARKEKYLQDLEAELDTRMLQYRSGNTVEAQRSVAAHDEKVRILEETILERERDGKREVASLKDRIAHYQSEILGKDQLIRDLELKLSGNSKEQLAELISKGVAQGLSERLVQHISSPPSGGKGFADLALSLKEFLPDQSTLKLGCPEGIQKSEGAKLELLNPDAETGVAAALSDCTNSEHWLERPLTPLDFTILPVGCPVLEDAPQSARSLTDSEALTASPATCWAAAAEAITDAEAEADAEQEPEEPPQEPSSKEQNQVSTAWVVDVSDWPQWDELRFGAPPSADEAWRRAEAARREAQRLKAEQDLRQAASRQNTPPKRGNKPRQATPPPNVAARLASTPTRNGGGTGTVTAAAAAGAGAAPGARTAAAHQPRHQPPHHSHHQRPPPRAESPERGRRHQTPPPPVRRAGPQGDPLSPVRAQTPPRRKAPIHSAVSSASTLQAPNSARSAGHGAPGPSAQGPGNGGKKYTPSSVPQRNRDASPLGNRPTTPPRSTSSGNIMSYVEMANALRNGTVTTAQVLGASSIRGATSSAPVPRSTTPTTSAVMQERPPWKPSGNGAGSTTPARSPRRREEQGLVQPEVALLQDLAR